MNKSVAAFVSAFCFIVSCPPLLAGPVLDDLLNYPVVDQRCIAGDDAEAMGLAIRGKCEWAVLSKETPLGQTIRLGDKAEMLWRVSTGICHWQDSWQEGEEVTFSVYDSPARNKKLYSRTLDFAHKWFKWDIPFDCHIPARPGAEFYFELTHNGGGDNRINVAKIPGDDYKQGQAFLAGKPQPDFDLYFVVISKPKGDRKANLKAFLSQFNYELPRLAEAGRAFEKGDLTAACKLLLRHFETRTEPDSLAPARPEPPGFDTTRADQICDEGRIYREPKEKGEWIEMSDQTTWREVWPATAEYVKPNDVFWELGRAYQATGNEKYARKMNDLMIDFMQDYTSPFDGGMRGARWVAMHIAWRLGDAWDGFGRALKSRGLTEDVRLAWLNYWCHQAEFAVREPSGGNHANAVGEAVMAFGHRFPEFAKAEEWKRFGFDKLISNSLDLFRDDGGCKEPTMNYHGFSLVNLLSGLEQAKKYGYAVPEEINKLVEKALSYTAYMLQPNGQIPSVGDTDTEDFRPNARIWDGWRKGEAMKAYQMFGRKDCLWIATAGKEGERPAQTSYAFPDTGHYILRSDFGGEGGKDFEQARYLFFRAGHFGSHGHWDLNGFEMYAYGRPLIIDPGRTRYDSPLMPVLSANTSHNVLLVDDQNMNRKGPKINAWRTTPGLDLIDSTYEGLYTNVDHRRAIVFVRPDYYVMFDHAVGREPHRIGINFWLTPPDVTIDRRTGAVHTNDPDGSNVLVKSISPEPATKDASPAAIEIADRYGKLDLADKIWENIPVVTFWQNNTSLADFVTLMYPFPKGMKPTDMKTTALRSGAGQVFVIDRGDSTDCVFYAPEPGKVSFGTSFGMEGRAGVLRLAGKRLEVSEFSLIDGTMFTGKDGNLAEAAKPVEGLSVRYLADRVEVTCSKGEPTLRIATLGRTRAVVNGKESAVSGRTFTPF
jgi:heparan-sulfate lyase